MNLQSEVSYLNGKSCLSWSSSYGFHQYTVSNIQREFLALNPLKMWRLSNEILRRIQVRKVIICKYKSLNNLCNQLSHSNVCTCTSWNDHFPQILTCATSFKIRESCFVIHKFDVTKSGQWSRLHLIFRLKNDNKIQLLTLIGFQNGFYYLHLVALSLLLLMSENLGWIMDWNKYLIIGDVNSYEYSNTWYLHFIIGNTQTNCLGDENDFWG